MKKVLALLGVVAACGLCCAFPAGLPLLGALAAASGVGLAFGWQLAVLAVLAVLAAAALMVWTRRRRARALACAPRAAGWVEAAAACAPNCGNERCGCSAAP
jgi:hypothetical protein